MHLLRELSEDRALACQVLFPHRHKQISPPFHVDIIDLWRSADELVVIEAFRQGAKTTLSEEFLLVEALFANFKYLLIFGETYTKACQRITSIRHELNTNRAITELFGNQKLKVSTENKIILPNNVCIEAHGWEEEIRGYLHLDARPDRAYLDDIETAERVRDTETVDKNWRKLYKQLLPAMDKDNRKVRMTGTPLADDCMIVRAKTSPNWVSGSFPIADEKGPLWPERYSQEWIDEERGRFEEQGMLSEFMQEYMLVPEGAAGKPFDESMMAYEDMAPYAYAPKIVIIDPARTADVKKSDQTGYVVVSQIGSRIFVHASGGKYWKPDEVVRGAFELSAEFGDAEVAIEKNSLDEWLLQPLRTHMLTTGTTLRLKVINAPQDRNKAQFIMGLQPFFKANDIVFIGGRSKHQQLISQILNFPKGKKDALNALAYSQRVFSGVPVYKDFGQANICQTYNLPRNTQLLLGANASLSETAVVLCAFESGVVTVLQDWSSPLTPSECIPDIAKALRAGYPQFKPTVWVPADISEQVGRNPLIAALKSAGLKPHTGEHTVMTRGALSTYLRTDLRGRRMLQVSSQSAGTLHGLASGYNWPLKPNNERAAEPERNGAKVLIEALEVLTFAVHKSDNRESEYTINATNPNGKGYMSALR